MALPSSTPAFCDLRRAALTARGVANRPSGVSPMACTSSTLTTRVSAIDARVSAPPEARAATLGQTT